MERTDAVVHAHHTGCKGRAVRQKSDAIAAQDPAPTAGDLLAADPTPVMAEGPFHPFGGGTGPAGDRRLRKWTDSDVDLTFVSDDPGTAQGYVAYVTGKVVDEDGRPVAGARVEVWQACASGRYNHRSDEYGCGEWKGRGALVAEPARAAPWTCQGAGHRCI